MVTAPRRSRRDARRVAASRSDARPACSPPSFFDSCSSSIRAASVSVTACVRRGKRRRPDPVLPQPRLSRPAPRSRSSAHRASPSANETPTLDTRTPPGTSESRPRGRTRSRRGTARRRPSRREAADAGLVVVVVAVLENRGPPTRVGDVDPDARLPVFRQLGAHRVVDLLGVGGVDRIRRQASQIFPRRRVRVRGRVDGAVRERRGVRLKAKRRGLSRRPIVATTRPRDRASGPPPARRARTARKRACEASPARPSRTPPAPRCAAPRRARTPPRDSSVRATQRPRRRRSRASPPRARARRVSNRGATRRRARVPLGRARRVRGVLLLRSRLHRGDVLGRARRTALCCSAGRNARRRARERRVRGELASQRRDV